jgi:hypothetical protein
MKNTAKQAISPVVSPARLKRLAALNKRLRGTFKDFMTLKDLKKMREDNKWEASAAGLVKAAKLE